MGSASCVFREPQAKTPVQVFSLRASYLTGHIWQGPAISSSRCLSTHLHRNRSQATRRSIWGRCRCDELNTRPLAESHLLGPFEGYLQAFAQQRQDLTKQTGCHTNELTLTQRAKTHAAGALRTHNDVQSRRNRIIGSNRGEADAISRAYGHSSTWIVVSCRSSSWTQSWEIWTQLQ